MRGRALALALILALAACDDDAGRVAPEPKAPGDVVRAWSRALNAGDNRAAGNLFALGARIEQGDLVIVVHARSDAARWTASLPCAGKIVGLAVKGQTATATFLLSDRATSACDAPGATVRAAFTVQNGRIVLFRQLGGQGAPVEPV